MQVFNPNNNTDVFCVYRVDPDTGLPQSSHTTADVSLLNVPGVLPYSFSGVRARVTTAAATPDVVQPVPTVLAPFAGVVMSVASDNAADTDAVLRISALGPRGVALAPIEVQLTGTTPIQLGTLSRINSISRTGGDILGNVRITNGADVYGFMEPGAQIQRSATFTVPAGYRIMIADIIAAMTKAGGKDSTCLFELRAKPMASSGFGSVIDISACRAGNSQVSIKQTFGTSSVGPIDLRMVAVADAAGTDVQAYVSGMLVNTAVHP